MSAKQSVPTPLLPLGPERARDGSILLRSSNGQSRALSALARRCRVGSAPDNDWVLQDPHVSKHHVVLELVGDRVRVTDCNSTNGTFLNGVRVSTGELPVGGCLTLGTLQIRLTRPDGGRASRLIGDSARMRQLRADIERMAPVALPVMVLGESGTGKELVAQALHEHSGRRGAFVALNCSTLPRELIESELFGHEKGAFTGASQRRAGFFGEAHGGTLFLDEVGELPLDLQPKLLRALETGTVRPVGANREVPVDVRVITATHRDLKAWVEEGRFRADLYYRLAGLELRLPPLRERDEDIPLLVRAFLDELSAEVMPCYIDEAELRSVAAYPWPGNVRQLKNQVKSAAHLHGPFLRARDIIPADHAPSAPAAAAPTAAAPPPASAPAQEEVRPFADMERQVYLSALQRAGNSRRAAAALLGIPKSTLCDKLRRLGISTEDREPGLPRRGAR